MRKQDLWTLKHVRFVGRGLQRKGGKLTGKVCTVVGIDTKLPARAVSRQLIPRQLEDAEDTDVIQVGVLKGGKEYSPQVTTTQDVNTGMRRPCPGGYSVGNERITAGTLGAWVAWEGDTWVMSNNHVLGASNEGAKNDRILQPGRYDGGTLPISLETYKVLINKDGGTEPPPIPDPGCLGKLLPPFLRPTGVPAAFSDPTQPSPNVVDLALSRAMDASVWTPEIEQIGPPTGFQNVDIGESVMRNGRTLGFVTGGLIEAIGDSQVDYGDFVALFTDQYLIRKEGAEFSAPGDSGSAIVVESTRAICGLLFAGGEGVTVANRIALYGPQLFPGLDVA